MEMLLNGEWVDRPAQREVRDPQNDAFIDTVPESDVDDMQAAIAAAMMGFETARRLPVHERMRVLREAADAIGARHEEFARTIAREGVKTIREARKEVTRCIETIRLSGEEARRTVGETISFDQTPEGEDRVGYYQREPVGIVGAISSFNDPLNLVAHKVGPAIAAGCAVIVKPHESTPLSSLLLVKVFEQVGLPPGILQVITGAGPVVGEALVEDARVRMISFTGGRKVGERIAARAGLKRLGLELGGNSPVLVMADADLELAVEATVSGAFCAAGQNCLHVQRLFVHEEVYTAFADRFVDRAVAYRVGDKLEEATEMGPLIDAAAADRVESIVDDALRTGARQLAGAERSGTFYAPTVLDRLPDESLLARKEIFGPVTVLYPFRTLDEALDRANGVDYGLHGAIFTRDLQTAFRAAKGLDCGGVMVNDSSDFRIDAMPFGGIKGSGLGREGVRFAVHEMTETKIVCFNL